MTIRIAGPRAVASAVVALALALLPSAAHACDLCAIYTGSMMQSEKTGLMIGVAEQYTSFETIRIDGHKVKNPANEWMHSSITQILVGWSFTRTLGVQLNLPLISREYRRIEEGHATRGDANGLGDLTLSGRWSPYSGAVKGTFVHAELLAGLKVPTGDSDRLSEELEDDHHEEEDEEHLALGVPRHGDEPSAVHGHDLALGSGSVDGVLGFSVYTTRGRWFGHLAAQYVIRGNGDFSYEYANDLTWEAATGFYVFAWDDWTASLGLVTSGENKGRDHQQGHLLDDTAITAVYLGPGTSITWRDDLHFDLITEAPIEQDNTGMQIVADYRLRTALLWRF